MTALDLVIRHHIALFLFPTLGLILCASYHYTMKLSVCVFEKPVLGARTYFYESQGGPGRLSRGLYCTLNVIDVLEWNAQMYVNIDPVR